MKADVLSGFKHIKVCVGYNYMGRKIEYLPYDLDQKHITPIYVTLKGWDENISDIRSIKQLPKSFKDYILFLETKLEKPISIISVGPDRSQTIFR